ncbi:MAG TPA: diguanylate cyclase [Bryobacteraceae bacterium]|nr:diguanylate cyclase [Bryobacteraceae bacterium]
MDGREKPRIPIPARIYITILVLAGFSVAWNCFHTWTPELPLRFVVYVVIALASSGMKVALPGVNGNISVNYVFTLLALLELSVPEALILALLSAGAQTFWRSRNHPGLIHLVFNLACITLTVRAAAAVYERHWLFGAAAGEFLRLTVAGVVYFVVNTLSVSIVIALTEERGIKSIWKGLFDWSFAYYLVGVSLAEMVHTSIERMGWAFTIALVPLLYLIYRSYNIYLSRLQQEKVHAESVAALHLRTIEALAMAIEAKDECTHKHLRRVQIYALKVAEHLGLSSEEMQALQAASILHDIGKLAVPDYIISKPGKLTPEEFEKMKIHTVVGASILEQVGFPYAVAPIVRSHHEKWDGTGYPDGLKGAQIPIGARILSAVDCVDALASERQYRRAMPLDDAMDYVASLSERSFDPKVIDVLKQHYREFEELAEQTPQREPHLDRNLVVSRGEAPDAGFEKSDANTAEPSAAEGMYLTSIAAARQEVQTLLELTHALSGSLRLQETLSIVAERLKQLIPFDCIAVYIREGDVLEPRYVNGEGSRTFATLKIPVGQGLSGWVVENVRPIVNGNPSVELAHLNDPGRFSLLQSAIAVPLGDKAGGIIGTLTLYRSEPDAYNKDHLRVLLAINEKISRAVESALRFQQAEHQASTDALTGLPNARSLLLHLREELEQCALNGRKLVVLFCDLDGFKQVNDRWGHLTGNDVLRHVARIMRTNCRDSDYVARMGGDEFVILLPGAGPDEALRRAATLDELVRRAGKEICGEDTLALSIGIASFPDDGTDADALISHADTDMYRTKRHRKRGLTLVAG